MNTYPLVSVGLPTYNRSASLRRAVDSILAQKYSNIELVISDNSSTDDTKDVCEEFCKRDCRVRYIRQIKNLGAEKNFREVLTSSNGEFFMWLADDDWLDNDYIARCVSVLESNHVYSLVAGKTIYYKEDLSSFCERAINLNQNNQTARVQGYYRQVVGNGVFYGLTRRKQILSVPLENIFGGDWLFVGDIAFLGKIVTLDDTIIHRSLQGTSENIYELARHYNLSQRQAKKPHTYLSFAVFQHIMKKSSLYHSLSMRERSLLAIKCGLLVYLRFSSPVWLHQLLSLIRQNYDTLLSK